MMIHSYLEHQVSFRLNKQLQNLKCTKCTRHFLSTREVGTYKKTRFIKLFLLNFQFYIHFKFCNCLFHQKLNEHIITTLRSVEYHFQVSFLWLKSGFYRKKIFPAPLCNMGDVHISLKGLGYRKN